MLLVFDTIYLKRYIESLFKIIKVEINEWLLINRNSESSSSKCSARINWQVSVLAHINMLIKLKIWVMWLFCSLTALLVYCYYLVSFLTDLFFSWVRPFLRFESRRRPTAALGFRNFELRPVLQTVDYFRSLLVLTRAPEHSLGCREVRHRVPQIIAVDNTNCWVAIKVAWRDLCFTERCWIYASSSGRYRAGFKDSASLSCFY